MTTRRPYNPPPRQLADGAQHRIRLADSISNVLQGRLNVTDDLVIPEGTTQLTLIDPRLHQQSWIGLMPKTPATATAINTIWYSDKTNGSLVINLTSAPSEDLVFEVLIIG